MRTSQYIQKIGLWSSLSEDERRQTCESIVASFRSVVDVEKAGALACALAESGAIWSWPTKIKPTADIPSTGGPSSLSTLVCPYIIAACGCYVPKVSVPGTVAGAIDVMQLLPGYRHSLGQPEMLGILESSRIAHTSNTSALAPADAYLFELRKKKGEKSNPALVVASLLSKKLAVSCMHSTVDVRAGNAGNMGVELSECIRNARFLLEVAEYLGVATSCVITDISEPLNPFMGRSESLYALVASLSLVESDPWLLVHLETCIRIAAEALLNAGITDDIATAEQKARHALNSGTAKEVLLANIEAQGASLSSLEGKIESYRASVRRLVPAKKAGYVTRIANDRLSACLASINQSFPDQNDRMGFRHLVQSGSRVSVDDPLVELRLDASIQDRELEHIVDVVAQAFEFGSEPPPSSRQILAVVGSRTKEGKK